LRFRYTTYMGEQHPAARKVVLEFAPKDLKEPAGLDDAQITKLIKLCGMRYNPETQIVKMSCESFETQAQNKRYLGDLVDKLIEESKDMTDMFEDVPIDRRHVKKKPFFHFPEQWKLTPERRKALEERRKLRLEAVERRQIEGGVIDGLGIIQQALAAKQAHMQAATVGAGTNGRKRLA
jgi:small subunit ribosomal protein S35